METGQVDVAPCSSSDATDRRVSRLASPVSWSYMARRRRSSCAIRRSVMSRKVTTNPPTDGVSNRSTITPSIQRSCPSMTSRTSREIDVPGARAAAALSIHIDSRSSGWTKSSNTMSARPGPSSSR